MQAQWSATTARVESCDLDQSSAGSASGTTLTTVSGYRVGAQEFVARVYSRSAPSRKVSQYPPEQIGPLEDWLLGHGTSGRDSDSGPYYPREARESRSRRNRHAGRRIAPSN